MNLDARSEMALNYIVNEPISDSDKFKALAFLCAQWGMNHEQSFPLAVELKNRLNITVSKACGEIRSILDERRANAEQRN